jgi:hypothetical protein
MPESRCVAVEQLSLEFSASGLLPQSVHVNASPNKKGHMKYAEKYSKLAVFGNIMDEHNIQNQKYEISCDFWEGFIETVWDGNVVDRENDVIKHAHSAQKTEDKNGINSNVSSRVYAAIFVM